MTSLNKMTGVMAIHLIEITAQLQLVLIYYCICNLPLQKHHTVSVDNMYFHHQHISCIVMIRKVGIHHNMSLWQKVLIKTLDNEDTCIIWTSKATVSMLPNWTMPHDMCYQQLHLPTLCAGHDYLSVCALQDICYNCSIPFSNYCTYNTIPMCSGFVLYVHCLQSMLGVIVTLCMFVLSGTRFPLTSWELKIVIPPFAMRPANISVVPSK